MTLRFLSESPKRLAISQFTEGTDCGNTRLQRERADHMDSTNSGCEHTEIQ